MSVAGVETWTHREQLEPLIGATIDEDASHIQDVPKILTRNNVVGYHGMSLDLLPDLMRFGYFRPPKNHSPLMRSIFHFVPNLNSNLLRGKYELPEAVDVHPVASAIRYAMSLPTEVIDQGTFSNGELIARHGVVLGIGQKALDEFAGFKMTDSTDDTDFPLMPELVMTLRKDENGRLMLPPVSIISSIHPVGEESREILRGWLRASERLQKV